MINIQNIDDHDKKFINEILEIDSLVYPKHLQGTFEDVYGRFYANRDIYILLYDGKKLIGYLCLFPIKDSLYERILNENILFDSNIQGEMLEWMGFNEKKKLKNGYSLNELIINDYVYEIAKRNCI